MHDALRLVLFLYVDCWITPEALTHVENASNSTASISRLNSKKGESNMIDSLALSSSNWSDKMQVRLYFISFENGFQAGNREANQWKLPAMEFWYVAENPPAEVTNAWTSGDPKAWARTRCQSRLEIKKEESKTCRKTKEGESVCFHSGWRLGSEEKGWLFIPEFLRTFAATGVSSILSSQWMGQSTSTRTRDGPDVLKQADTKQLYVSVNKAIEIRLEISRQ